MMNLPNVPSRWRAAAGPSSAYPIDIRLASDCPRITLSSTTTTTLIGATVSAAAAQGVVAVANKKEQEMTTEITPSSPEPTTTTTTPSDDGSRDWSELPMDALLLVFARLGPVEILMGSGLACHSWLQAAKEPSLWASLDMASHRVVEEKRAAVLRKMAMAAVDRSKGRLEAFAGKYFVTDELLKHISVTVSRSSSSVSLRSLSLVSCDEVSNRGFTELVASSPELEELSLELCPNVGGRHVLEAAGRACPRLRRLSLRRECFRFSLNYSRRTAEALGIAAAMAGLRSLTLVSCNINNDELAAVVDGCPRLETLRLRDCYKVIADASLRAKCAGITTLTLPDSRA